MYSVTGKMNPVNLSEIFGIIAVILRHTGGIDDDMSTRYRYCAMVGTKKACPFNNINQLIVPPALFAIPSQISSKQLLISTAVYSQQVILALLTVFMPGVHSIAGNTDHFVTSLA